MSVIIPAAGGLNAPATTVLATDSATPVYANANAADSRQYEWVVAVGLTNVDAGNAVDATLEWHDGAAGHVFFKKTLAAGSSAAVDAGLPIRLEPGWTIRATASVADRLAVTVIAMRAGK